MNDEPPLPASIRPRIWPALTVATLALLGSGIIAAIVQIVAMVATGLLGRGENQFDYMAGLQRLMEQPWGPAVLILPGQLTMLVAALAGALLSPHRLAPRLGFTRSVLPWRALPLLLGGTFFAAGLGGLLVQSLFDDPGPAMRMLYTMMQKASGTGLVCLALLLCVLPPLAEESLFRGYLQRRLLQRWPPAVAIAASSIFFVAAHFDPVHVLAVVPLAVWLGIVAWRCDSIWPSMLCHAAQNSFAVWTTRQGDPFEREVTTAQFVALAIAGALTIGAVIVMRRHPVSDRNRCEPSALPPLP